MSVIDRRRQRLKVMVAGICSLILCMGVARFLYTPLLPLMQKQAGLGLAEGGWLAAANYAGYLTGALAAAMISDMGLKDRLYRIGIVSSVITTAMMGMSDHLAVWLVSRYLAGLGTAAGMLMGTGLVLNWLIRHNYRSELGLHFAGVGIGIAFCGMTAMVMGHWTDWQGEWYAFTLIGALLAVPALAWLPRPENAGVTTSGHALVDSAPSSLFMGLFMASYFCAGVGFVVSATFIVAIVNHLPGLEGQGTMVFVVLGIAAAPACVVWDLIARRIGGLNALIVASVAQIGGILLPVAGGGLIGPMAGALLFGGTFIGMVSLVLTMAGRFYPSRPAKMMGKMTISYGVAQILAPAVIGWLAAGLGSYEVGLYLAAAIMTVGTAILIVLKMLERREEASTILALS